MNLKKYLAAHPETQYLDALLCDLCCVFRGKRYPIAAAEKVFSGDMLFPGSSCFLSATGECQDSQGLGFSDGDPDQVARVVPDSLVPCPWSRYPTAQVLFTLESADGTPYYYEPRNVLARVLARFAELKLTPVVAFELEFYLLDPNQPPQPPPSPLSGEASDATQVYSADQVEEFSNYLHEVVDACAQQGIPCGAITAEYAPGQFEINLHHSDDILKCADQCAMFRRVVQGVARKHQMRASFMAKPRPDSAGSGLHLHISLRDRDGNNVFDGGGDYGGENCASLQLRHALGGLLQSLPEGFAIFAPSVNSYKRFVPDSYVPVQPCWGFDNRSVALRIPQGPGTARRIEHRVAGADANPYLALAAVLAGIHHGLSTHAEVAPPTRGNAGAALSPNLPFTLPEALKKCAEGKILSEYLGAEYLALYLDCKLQEMERFVASGMRELDWYL